MAAPSAIAAPAAPLEPERRLIELAHSAGPLRRVVAALAGRLVAARSWERLGYARLGDYARERLGLSVRSLQEFAHVDRALGELPRLESALVSGMLPWSKVRLLARFVSGEDEASWIARAGCLNVRALERACRVVDRGALEAGAVATDEEGGEPEAREWVRLSAPFGLALKWRHTLRNSAKVAGEPTSPAVALELLTAEALSALPVRVVAEGLAGSACQGTSWHVPAVAASESRRPPRRAEAVCAAEPCAPDIECERAELPRFLRPFLRDLNGADAFALDARLRRAIRLEQRLDAEIAPLLRHVSQAGFAWRRRHHTLSAFAREHLGMSPRKARALVRLEQVGDVCPELRAAYRDGRLSWLQAQILAPLLLVQASGNWRQAWVAWASQVTVRRLDELVDQALWLRESDPRRWERGLEGPEALDASLTSRDETGEQETDEQDGRQCVRDRRTPSAPSGSACGRRTVPGCSGRRNLHAHHIVFRSAGGSDALENQTTLCAFHHQRGVHGRTVRITGRGIRSGTALP